MMAGNSVFGEFNVLQILKEDILEALGRKKDKEASSLLIEPEVKASRSLISKALRELEKEGLVQTEGELIFLTKQGIKKSENLIKRHSILEDYFKETRTKKEAWKAADIFEHYVSREVLNNIKKLSTFKKEGIPLTEFSQKEGLITDIVFNPKLFERMISMGIFPGEKIKIINRLPNNITFEVRNKKFTLARKIAEGIKVLSYEKP